MEYALVSKTTDVGSNPTRLANLISLTLRKITLTFQHVGDE
jgi:hypothetical protein